MLKTSSQPHVGATDHDTLQAHVFAFHDITYAVTRRLPSSEAMDADLRKVAYVAKHGSYAPGSRVCRSRRRGV